MLIGFGIGGITLCQALFIFAGQACPQRGGDFLGEVSLQRKNIRRLAAVLFAPDVAVVAGIDQFRADRQVVAALA